MDKDLKSKTLDELERLVVGLGGKKYLAGYIFSFIHTRGIKDLSEITPLSKSFRSRLIEQGYYISALEVVDRLTDPDGTVKYVFGLPEGGRVEAVLLFDPGKSERFPGLSPGNSRGISQGDGRRTLCVSTQVGCGMGCCFCATGRLGLGRNLTAGEIVDQVNLVVRDASCVARVNNAIRNTQYAGRVTNVVFMGMGEPLANYDSVISAVRILNHPKGRNIGIRHLTISTCGLPEAIERLADEGIQPRLAISLNAPTDAIRRRLMPIAKKYPLGRLFEGIVAYQRKTHNRVTIEYCMIKGVNDTALHAKLLVKRLQGITCNVNLIEYNPPTLDSRYSHLDTRTSIEYRASSIENIERFARVLKESGLVSTIRQKFGQTINAACGQLGSVSAEGPLRPRSEASETSPFGGENLE